MTVSSNETTAIPFGFDSTNYTYFSSSGALGLAPSNNESFPSYVDSLKTDGKIDEKLVSWSMVSDEPKASTNSSEVSFGAGIAGAYNGNLFSHESINNDSWTFNFSGLYYDYDEVSP